MDTEDTTANGRTCATGTCGNRHLDPDEVCDDGNNRSGDGCPADCSAPCGDGVLDPGEACDDGNTVDGDGCSADCSALDGLFLVSPQEVTFMATEGEAVPAAVAVTVRLPYRDDAVAVGFAPGVPQPGWLSLASGPRTANAAEFDLQVTDTSVSPVRISRSSA